MCRAQTRTARFKPLLARGRSAGKVGRRDVRIHPIHVPAMVSVVPADLLQHLNRDASSLFQQQARWRVLVPAWPPRWSSRCGVWGPHALHRVSFSAEPSSPSLRESCSERKCSTGIESTLGALCRGACVGRVRERKASHTPRGSQHASRFQLLRPVGSSRARFADRVAEGSLGWQGTEDSLRRSRPQQRPRA
jgi:hypothetical protein